MDIDLVQARWVLGLVPDEQLPEVAAQAMVQGFNGPGILDLASFDQPTLHLIKPEHVEAAFREMGRTPIARDVAALRLAKEIALKILRGQLSVEQGAVEIFDLNRRCQYDAPKELLQFESWSARFGDDAAASPEYAQAIVEWAWEMVNQEPGR